jgi:hypothetical protein
LQQQQAAAFPQSSPLQDSSAVRDEWRRAYKDFKPSADVARRIEELKNRERKAFELFKNGAIMQGQLSIEIERNAMYRRLLLLPGALSPYQLPQERPSLPHFSLNLN